jgi:hypothetical protein
MVVCPSCRQVNTEEASVCERCGNSLEPGYTALLPVRRSEAERPPLELKGPKPPSKWRPYVIIGLFVGVLAVASGAYLLRPDPCEGANFESDMFGYCIAVPEGWVADVAQFGADVRLDQFAPPTESAVVMVEAVDLEEGTPLEGWSEVVRTKVEGAGLTPGPTSVRELDGVGALQWDVTIEPGDGAAFRMRDVVVVRDDFGWRITLVDLAEGFDTSAVVFAGMLDSWQFA